MASSVTPWWQTGWVALPILGGAALAGAGAAALRVGSPPPAPPLCPDIDTRGGVLEGIEYVERQSGGASPNETLPMLVVFHGAGMTAPHMAELATAIPVKARIVAPVGFYPVEGGAVWRDPRHESPLDEDAASFASFLEQIRRCRPTVGLPVLAGYDQGADMAYQVAVEYPDLVTGVVGAGGRAPRDIVGAKTVVLHGVDDQIVPFPPEHEIWLTIIAQGAPVRVVRMFGVGHSFAGALQIKTWQEATRMLVDPRPLS